MTCPFHATEDLVVRQARKVLKPGKSWPPPKPDPPAKSKSKSKSNPEPEPPPREWPATADQFAKDSLAFPADAKQTEILAANAAQARRVIVCCTRQWGKSTTAAIKALHHALTKPGSLTLIASLTRHQAAELLEKAAAFARSLELRTRCVPGHPSSLQLANGSRLIAIPGRPASIRGYSAVSLLIVDEAAYVPDSLYEALRPMLATTDGAIWLLSTPNGRKGFFFREWIDASATWTKFSVPANDCTRISQKFLEEERRKHGQAIFDREYLCKFTTSGDTYFDAASAAASTITPDYPQQLGQQGATYLTTRHYVGFDLGQRASHSAIIVLERAEVTTKDRSPVDFSWIKRTEIHLRRAERLPLDTPYPKVAERLHEVIKGLPNPKDVTLVLDATGCGAPFLDILKRQHVSALMMPVMIMASGPPTPAKGVTRIAKTDLMSSLNCVVTSPDFKINAPAAEQANLIKELESVRMLSSANGSTRFTSTERDDLVMAFALAVWPCRKFLDASRFMAAQ